MLDKDVGKLEKPHSKSQRFLISTSSAGMGGGGPHNKVPGLGDIKIDYKVEFCSFATRYRKHNNKNND